MHTRRSVVLRATAVVALALVLVGCGSRGSEPDAEPAAAVECAQFGEDAPTAGRVPANFEPVAVYRCDQFAGFEDAEGQWSAVSADRLEGDLAPLLDALNAPDDARWPGPCAAIMVFAPELWLVDAEGAAIRVALPVDGCSQPKVDPVNQALAGLTVTDTSTERLELVETRAALEAGCPTRSQTIRIATLEELTDEGVPLLGEGEVSSRGFGTPLSASVPPSAPSSAPSAPGAVVPIMPMPLLVTPDTVEGMLLCRYDSDAPLPGGGTAGASVGLPDSGTFVGGRTLGVEDALTVLAAAKNVDGAGADPCGQVATEFVALYPLAKNAINGSPITVEVDGCRRLTVFGAGFVPASAELLAIVS